MAIRGAATACIGRQRHPSLLSIPHCLHLSFHPSSRPLHGQLLSPPISQRGGYKYPIRAVQGATADSVATRKKDENEVPQDWKIKMLYDGDCPLCMHEVNMLRQRNKGYGTIKFVNISSDDYSPEENQGLDFKTAMGRIHAILSDGTVVTDVEAFRRLYEQVGLGWVYAITKYEPITTIADVIYGVWAKYRLQITGRPDLEEILKARRKKVEVCGDKNACKM